MPGEAALASEREGALNEATNLLRPTDESDRTRLRARLVALAAQFERAERRAASEPPGSALRDWVEEVAAAARKLERKLQTGTELHHRALTGARWLVDWSPGDTAALCETLKRLQETAGRAIGSPALEGRSGRGKRFMRTGTLTGWLACELAYLLDERGLPVTAYEGGVLAKLAQSVFSYATGKEAPQTVSDKAKRAATLMKKMQVDLNGTEAAREVAAAAEQELDEL